MPRVRLSIAALGVLGFVLVLASSAAGAGLVAPLGLGVAPQPQLGLVAPPRLDLLTPPDTGLVPAPDQDPFYAVPANIAQLPNGTVLASRSVQAMALAVPIPANAWQVKYKTIDQHGQPSAFVTTILVPQTPWQGPGARPLLSYQVAMDSLSTKCAPSFVIRAGVRPVSEDRPGRVFGRGAGDRLGDDMQPSYAPKLQFAGAALGGTPASFQAAIADFAANSGAKAAIPLLLAAFERSYPQWNLGQYLSPAGRTAVTNSQSDCLLDSLIRNAGVDPTSYEAYRGAIFNNPHLDRLLGPVSLLGYPGVPRTPILYHSTNDELASIAKMRELAARYCAEGVTVHIVTSPAGDHIAYVITGFPTALDYIAHRFAGETAPNDCPATPHPARHPKSRHRAARHSKHRHRTAATPHVASST